MHINAGKFTSDTNIRADNLITLQTYTVWALFQLSTVPFVWLPKHIVIEFKMVDFTHTPLT